MEDMIKVLVVDDAAFMRRAVADILESDPQIRVLDFAKDGLEGLQKIKLLNPDVVTLDIDMPVMDGLSSIRHMMIESPVPVVVLSSLFSDGAVTFEALRLGVVDFIPKPSGAISRDIERSKQQIIDRTKMAYSVNLENIRRVRLPKWHARDRLADRYQYRPLDYILVVGTNLTGPNTIIRLLTQLTPAIPAAIVVVKEISSKIVGAFVEKFDELVPWKVEVASDDQMVHQGVCYVCPNESSIQIMNNTNGEIFLKIGKTVENPLDLLFSSAARVFRQHTVGLLLTGTGRDGANGFKDIKAASGITLAQESRCCVYPNLTENAIQKKVVDIVVNESKMPAVIEEIME
jgi:two-component system chemotaxis response regulator CheB